MSPLAIPPRTDRSATWRLPCLLAAAAFALASSTAPDRLFGNDAAHFVHWIATGTIPAAYHNPLYPRLALALHSALRPADPAFAMQVLSALGMAIGVGFTTAAVGRAGRSGRSALGIGTLIAVTPVVWFFGAVVETHSLQFATMAFATWLTLSLDWRNGRRATILLALALALAQLTHPTSLVFGPGFLLLAHAMRPRADDRFGAVEFVAKGVVLLAGMLGGGLLSRALRGLPPALPTGESFATIREFAGAFGIATIAETWLMPLALLAPLQLVALGCALRRATLRDLALAASIVPATAFFLWWSVPERGAYLIGTIPATALLLASLTRARTGVRTVLLLILVQAAIGAWELYAFGSEQRLGERIARLQSALDGSGLVLSASDNAPPAQHYAPGLEEINLTALALQQPDDRVLTDSLVAFVREELKRRPVVLDLSYRLRGGMRGMEGRIEAIERELRARFVVRDVPDRSWPLLAFDR
jgi:hypothetical protein